MSTAVTLQRRNEESDRCAGGDHNDGGEESNSDVRSTKEDVASVVKDAMTRVVATKLRTEELHARWRNHLRRLSFLVLALSLRPLHDSSCFREHMWNVGRRERGVWERCLCHVGNVALAILLVYITNHTNTTGHPHFTTTAGYLTSCLLVPCIIVLFFVSSSSDEEDTQQRSFPISVMFHAILSGAYWFMQKGRIQCDEQLRLVHRLQTQLETKTPTTTKKEM